MVEGEDTGWLVVFEKKGLHQAAEILENCWIDSEPRTDVSMLDRDDFCKLASRGLKPLEAKKMLSPLNHMPMVQQLQLL